MTIPAWGLIPFVLMLLSIALFPLIPATAGFWERPRNQLIVALILGLPVATWMIAGGEPGAVVGAVIEYFQFIMLLLCLFTVAGGIYLRGDVEATPRNNTIFLAIGGAIASFIGTTGAAMLLIRPILKTNEERKHVAHTVVYAIFIVANAGGLLTPLGDPPLFLGMLRGVPFTWTFSLFKEWAFVLILLLVSYYCLDRKFHAMESPEDTARDKVETEPMHLDGKINFLFFAIIIVCVAIAPSMNAAAIEEGTATFTDWIPTREIIMALAALASLKFGDDHVRYNLNKFVWAPILEVAAIFVGIFLTMIPALRYLAEVAPKLNLNEASFYFLTGSLSSVLDNAPTYATFFSIAGELPGDPRVAGVPEHYLVAISLGAVFFGAMTYIGNGPNFMVKSVAESAGIAMPSFGGYIGKSLLHLFPVLVAVCGFFVAPGAILTPIAVLCTVFELGRAGLNLRAGKEELAK